MTRTLFSAAVVVLIGAVSVSAQTRYEPGRQDDRTYVAGADVWDGYELPAFVSVVEGYAELDRAGQSSRDIENVPLEAGDRIRTTRGRVEILFDDGSVIALDEHTIVTFVTATEVELLRGRVRAQWQDRGTLAGLTIYTEAGSAIVRTRGDYRVTLSESRMGEAEIELAVTRGSAELANDLGRTLVRERTRALTTATYAPSVPYAYTTPRDEFERWTDNVEADRYGVVSARYLPTELRYYGGVFDRHGSWQQHHAHGWVWYPRVSMDWRPYDGGRWSFVIGFGYSWVGGSRWAWPTHHHGRWDRVDSRWYWIPVRPTYHRAVGYAAPRPSYTVNVDYYNPTAYRATVNPQLARRSLGEGGAAIDQRSPRSAVRSPRSTGQAVPRNPQSGTNSPRSTVRSPEPARRSLGEGGSTVRSPQSTVRSPQSTVRRPQSAVGSPQSDRAAPQAVPRTAPRTETRPTPQRSSPMPRTAPPGQRTADSGPRTAPPQRSSPQPRSAPPDTTRSAPQRSAPRADPPGPRTPDSGPRTAPPPSGSRTPSRTAPPPSGGGASDNRARSGTAVRRSGGG